MALVEANEIDNLKQEEQLMNELDKGIDDMEAGRTVPHDKAMQMIKEKLDTYAV